MFLHRKKESPAVLLETTVVCVETRTVRLRTAYVGIS